MKSKGMVSLAAGALVLAMAASGAEAKNGNNKSALLGAAGGVAAGVAGTLLYQKMKSSGSESTGSLRRGVDQTSTGSVYRASSREECSVRQVDLFDKRGNFVKAERMRVCQ